MFVDVNSDDYTPRLRSPCLLTLGVWEGLTFRVLFPAIDSALGGVVYEAIVRWLTKAVDDELESIFRGAGNLAVGSQRLTPGTSSLVAGRIDGGKTCRPFRGLQ